MSNVSPDKPHVWLELGGPLLGLIVGFLVGVGIGVLIWNVSNALDGGLRPGASWEKGPAAVFMMPVMLITLITTIEGARWGYGIAVWTESRATRAPKCWSTRRALIGALIGSVLLATAIAIEVRVSTYDWHRTRNLIVTICVVAPVSLAWVVVCARKRITGHADSTTKSSPTATRPDSTVEP